MNKILNIAGAVLAFAVLIIIFSFARSIDSRQATYSEEQIRLSKLQASRAKIIDRQNDRISELEDESRGDGHLMLLFTEPDAHIYSDIYPISDDNPCNLLIDLSDLPGEDGNLTWDEIHSLLDAGWGLCLGWDGSSDLAQWHDQMQQIITDFELPDVPYVYLTALCYTDEIKDSLYSLGYHTVIQHGETGEISCTALQNDIWLPGAVGWYSENSSSMPKSLAYNGGSLVFTIGFTYSDEIYDQNRFLSLIERTDYYKESCQLSVCSVESSYEYYKELTNKTSDIYNDSVLIAIQEELDEVDKQISELEAIIKQSNTDNKTK